MNFSSYKNKKLFIISGPCSLESKTLATEVAGELKNICNHLNLPLVFKGSFDKANRSSINTSRGPGISEGLKILQQIKKEHGLVITSDVHTPDMVGECSTVLDVIQIPAFLARQTDFYIQAGKYKKSITVKKAQFMSPYEVKNIINKFAESGGEQIAIIERGTSFGYHNLVVDFRSIKIIKDMSVPYIYDASHSLQLPATYGSASGGQREFLEGMLFAQIAGGADGIFIETHPDPAKAISDKETQYPLSKMKNLLEQAKKLFEFRNKELSL